MYCPACGSETSADQKYCRSCGMPLDSVTQAVGEHFGDRANVSLDRPRQLERVGAVIGLSGFTALTLLLVSVFVCLVVAKLFGLRFEDFGFDAIGPVVAPIAILMLLAGAVLMGYRTARRELSTFWSTPTALPPKRTGALPPVPDFESVPSVTEHTTEPLQARRGNAPARERERATGE